MRLDRWQPKTTTARSAAGLTTFEKPNEEGYAVQYADGYTSWSPKAVFEAAYKPVTAMGFEGALAAMKDGHKVSRLPVLSPVLSKETMLDWHLDADDLFADDWMIVAPGESQITEAEGEHC